MVPTRHTHRSLRNRGRDDDTRSLISVPSLTGSGNTIDSSSTSDEPPMVVASHNSARYSSLNDYLKSAESSCVHSFQVVDSRAPNTNPTCQDCRGKLDESFLECTRCAIQQCQTCHTVEQPWIPLEGRELLDQIQTRNNRALKIITHSGLAIHHLQRSIKHNHNTTDFGDNHVALSSFSVQTESTRRPPSYLNQLVQFPSESKGNRAVFEESAKTEDLTTRDKETISDPREGEDLSGVVSDGASSSTSSSDESCATTRASVGARKEQVIKSIIGAITKWLRLCFIQAQNSADKATAGSCVGGSASSGISNQSSGDEVQRARKRKLDDNNNDEGENDDDDDIGPPNSGVNDKKGKGKEVLRFACPYFKFNPTKYQGWPVCPGPGWLDVHRVKEHLYRKHRQAKFRCMRCWECFESEQDYVDHQRAPTPCELKESEPIEGFDADQERQLRSRKKKSHVVSEVDKWRAVFQILFPHIMSDEIPSPFYEYDQLASSATRSHETLTECEEFVLREIPLRLRKLLTLEFDRDFEIIEQSLRVRAIEHTKTLIASLFQEFRNLRQQDAAPAMTLQPGDHPGPSLSQAQSSWFNSPENCLSFLDAADLNVDFSFLDETVSFSEEFHAQNSHRSPRDQGDSVQELAGSGYVLVNLQRAKEQAADESGQTSLQRTEIDGTISLHTNELAHD
ncbi:hypothetical protein F5Y03DRAFT_215068 [Xylaria venustula]|nr:hypothetical protein F5Y03DRAFT_215068 [Xylaria venustula]